MIDKILANPKATPKQLLRVSKTGHLTDVGMHPNCPPDLFFQAAMRAPLLLHYSPAAPLHILASPERYQQLCETSALRWVENHFCHKFINDADMKRVLVHSWNQILPLCHKKDMADQRIANEIKAWKFIVRYRKKTGSAPNIVEKNIILATRPLHVERVKEFAMRAHYFYEKALLFSLSIDGYSFPFSEAQVHLKDMAWAYGWMKGDRQQDTSPTLACELSIMQWKMIIAAIIKHHPKTMPRLSTDTIRIHAYD
jgi:hypothetical protein